MTETVNERKFCDYITPCPIHPAPEGKEEICKKCGVSFDHPKCQHGFAPAPTPPASWEERIKTLGVEDISFEELGEDTQKRFLDFIAAEIALAWEEGYEQGVNLGGIVRKDIENEAVQAERERIRAQCPLFRAGVLENGETAEHRKGYNQALKEIRENDQPH